MTRSVVATITLAVAGILVSIALGVVTARLITPSVGISEEAPSVSEELVEQPVPGGEGQVNRRRGRDPGDREKETPEDERTEVEFDGDEDD